MCSKIVNDLPAGQFIIAFHQFRVDLLFTNENKFFHRITSVSKLGSQKILARKQRNGKWKQNSVCQVWPVRLVLTILCRTVVLKIVEPRDFKVLTYLHSK